MIDALTEPFQFAFMQRALLAGVLAACTTSLVGTWVVVRGNAFIADALAHGVMPGIALAFVLGASLQLGALIGAGFMIAGVYLVTRTGWVREDAAIGLLFVGMLALGVIILSREPSYATTLTSFLFGSLLGVTDQDLTVAAVVLVAVAIAVVGMYRPFMALAFDPRKAAALGLFPRTSHLLLLALVALAVVASFSTVGTMLVFAMLVAPPATGVLVARTMPMMMAVAIVVAVACTWGGLIISYHAGTAASATVAFTTVAVFVVALALRELAAAISRRSAAPAAG